MKATPQNQLEEEMAFIAFHFHWGHRELLALEHGDRRRWCRAISAINQKLDGIPANPFDLN